MQIGIIGSGIVGRVLGAAFAAEGHQVMLGTRHVQKPEVTSWLAENPGTQAGSFAQTAAFGELIVLATGGTVTLEAVELAGIAHFSGKTVMDATNPIAQAPPVNGVLQYFTGPNESLMEKIQAVLPEAKLVKAFSSVGNAQMYKPDFRGILPTMFICGNDAAAKQTVTAILQQFGWEALDCGGAEAARAIEPLAMLWCIPGFLHNEWTHAFKVLHR